MRRVHEEDVPLTRLSGRQRGSQFFVQKQSLVGGMFGQVFWGGTGIARTICHFSPSPFKN